MYRSLQHTCRTVKTSYESSIRSLHTTRLEVLLDELSDTVADGTDDGRTRELEHERHTKWWHGRHCDVAWVLVQHRLRVLLIAHNRSGTTTSDEAILVETTTEPRARKRDALFLEDLVLWDAVREQTWVVPAEGRDDLALKRLLACKVVRRNGHEDILLALETLDTVHPVGQNVLVALGDEHVPRAPHLLVRWQERWVTVHVHHALVVVVLHERLHALLAPRNERRRLVRVRREHDVVALNALARGKHHGLTALLNCLDLGVVAHLAVVFLREELEEWLDVRRANVPPLVTWAVRAAAERTEDHLPQRNVQRVRVGLEAAQELRGWQVEHVLLWDGPQDRAERQEVVAEELWRVLALGGPFARGVASLHRHAHELPREVVDVDEDTPDATIEEPRDAVEWLARREVDVAHDVRGHREAHGDALVGRAVGLGDTEGLEPVLDVRVRVAEHHEADVHHLAVDLHVVRVAAEAVVLLEQHDLMAVLHEVVRSGRAADAGANNHDLHVRWRGREGERERERETRRGESRNAAMPARGSRVNGTASRGRGPPRASGAHLPLILHPWASRQAYYQPIRRQVAQRKSKCCHPSRGN